MKTIKLKYVVNLLIGVFIMFSSCEKDFLKQLPKDQITVENFFIYPKDFQIYLNQFYPVLSKLGHIPDVRGDDASYLANYDSKMEGTMTVPSSGGGWDFAKIRAVNFLFENYNEEKIAMSPKEYYPYLGEAYFFRAYLYFKLVVTFGDVPYLDKVLDMDSEELYNPRTPRQQVIDSVIADLDKAIEYMISGSNNDGMRLNKECAQLFKSRVCLYEGTWEKYHDGTVFGVSDPKIDEYMEEAADAAKDLIESNKYRLYTTGNPKNDYYATFSQTYFSGIPEAMLWEKYSIELEKPHTLGGGYTMSSLSGVGLTKNYIDDFLCSDGLPKAVSPLYKGDTTLMAVMANRDSRLNQSVFAPGDPELIDPYPAGDTIYVWERALLGISAWPGANPTGYEWKKGFVPNPAQSPFGWGGSCYTGTIIFRFAEALLNYAEAKGELGTITQADIDMTINKLRERVGMPHLDINNISNDPDWVFPDLSPIINEIRRERRVELAGEGLRWNDLARWRAHKIFAGKRFLGAKFDPVMYPDRVPGVDLFLNEDGYVDHLQKRLPEGFKFNPERDYLDPLPTDQLTLNKNLDQNPGW